MNPQRDRGIRTEREACVLLGKLTGWDVKRRANEGIREDIGDLIGVPGTTVQVSAVPPNPAVIWQRAKDKTAGCTEQQRRHHAAHGVTLLRIDRGPWRALCTAPQLEALGFVAPVDGLAGVAPGSIIHWAPYFADWWVHAGFGIYVTTVERWAGQIAHVAKAAA